MTTSPRPKLFRDPIHNIIAFDHNDEVERVLWSLICTRTFQRLRRVRQMGFAHLVYHGAEHSRFSHSLGVVHVARKVLDTLHRQGLVLDPIKRLEVLAAALLHDIGHGPFSHAIEKVTQTHHETYTLRLIKEPGSDVYEILHAVDPDLPERVCRYFDDTPFDPAWYVLKEIVSSQLDADRLDYILRDSMATGVKIGIYDFERIISMLEVHTERDNKGQVIKRRLVVSYRAREAVEGYLIARFHMYKQVYLHKVARAAEKMLEAVFARGSELYRAGYTFSMPIPPGMDAILKQEVVPLEHFIQMDDSDVWFMLKLWRDDPDDVLREMSTGLLDRVLYKTIDLDKDDPVLVARTFDRAREFAKADGLDPRYAVLADRAQNTPYTPYNPKSKNTNQAYLSITDRHGNIRPIDQQSDLIHLLGSDDYKMWRVCLPERLRDKMISKG